MRQIVLFLGSIYLLAALKSTVIDAAEIRVVNGTDADIAHYPYKLSMRRESGSHTCGATLISPTWVLGSSICVYRLIWVSFYQSGSGGPTGETFSFQHSATRISVDAVVNISQIAETITHPNFLPYENVSFIHDVTLFRLTQPVNITRYAILPTQFSDIAGGTPATILGWGLNETEPEGVIQEHLQEATVIVISDEDCRSRHENVIHSSQICAFSDFGSTHCRGDAGGPLLVNGIQIGLYTWRGSMDGPCGERPKVYTQISYYREWIRQITGV